MSVIADFTSKDAEFVLSILQGGFIEAAEKLDAYQDSKADKD